jgi:hypothetical protein
MRDAHLAIAWPGFASRKLYPKVVSIIISTRLTLQELQKAGHERQPQLWAERRALIRLDGHRRVAIGWDEEDAKDSPKEDERAAAEHEEEAGAC